MHWRGSAHGSPPGEAVERSETDEDRRNVSTINAVRKKGAISKVVPSYLTALRGVSCRRSSSAPCGGTFPPGEGIDPLNSPIVDHGTTNNKKTFPFFGKVFSV